MKYAVIPSTWLTFTWNARRLIALHRMANTLGVPPDDFTALNALYRQLVFYDWI